jgi:hypothetical protein
MCARCKHRPADHSAEVESFEEREKRRAELGERARQELIARVQLAKSTRGEQRAQRWREMLPPPEDDFKSVQLRKVEGSAIEASSATAAVPNQGILRPTPTDRGQSLARLAAPPSQAQAAPPTSFRPTPAATPREKGPEASAFVRFLDAVDIVTMQEAFGECCKLCEIGGEGSPLPPLQRYEALKRRLQPQLNYADRQIFEILDKKLRRPASQDASALTVAIVGAGPVGLRTALELALCGARVHVLEKRKHFNRLNILHLWEWVCSDLLGLGATGADLMGTSFFHIGTCQLQLLLAQSLLLLGGEILTSCEYTGFSAPAAHSPSPADPADPLVDVSDGVGRVQLDSAADSDVAAAAGSPAAGSPAAGSPAAGSPADGSSAGAGASTPTGAGELWTVSYRRVGGEAEVAAGTLPVHALVAAGGAHDLLLGQAGLARVELKGKEALGVVAHFQNDGAGSVDEFSWASQFNRGMFERLRAAGLDLENVVHYCGATHYFVATPTRECLVSGGVLSADGAVDQVDYDALRSFMRKLATFYGLPEATPCLPQPHGAMLFDFSKRASTSEAVKYLVDEKSGAQLAVLVVGDALMEPFWPEGLGVNRGFLSALDAVWLLVHFHRTGRTSDTRLALSKRAELLEKLKSLSAFTKDTILRPEYQSFELLPSTRYKLFEEPR